MDSAMNCGLLAGLMAEESNVRMTGDLIKIV